MQGGRKGRACSKPRSEHRRSLLRMQSAAGAPRSTSHKGASSQKAASSTGRLSCCTKGSSQCQTPLEACWGLLCCCDTSDAFATRCCQHLDVHGHIRWHHCVLQRQIPVDRGTCPLCSERMHDLCRGRLLVVCGNDR